MLISGDLLRYMAQWVEPPAQLCLTCIIGSDNQYIFRVRYQDVHMDYPFTVPLFDSASEVEAKVNFDEIGKALHVMSKMVVPPGTEIDRQYGPYVPAPQILAPEKFQ